MMLIRHSGEKKSVFFFFQAEDGIRDLTVTGVQTCALPIYVPTLLLHGDADRILPPDATSRRQATMIKNVKFVELKKDRKSTRLNSSHSQISYAVFCLKKKKSIRPP